MTATPTDKPAGMVAKLPLTYRGAASGKRTQGAVASARNPMDSSRGGNR